MWGVLLLLLSLSPAEPRRLKWSPLSGLNFDQPSSILSSETCAQQLRSIYSVSPCHKKHMVDDIRTKVLGTNLLTLDAMSLLKDMSITPSANATQSVNQLALLHKQLRRPILVQASCSHVCPALDIIKQSGKPVVMLVLGRDDKGSPVKGCGKGNSSEIKKCFRDVLELPNLLKFITSQHKSSFQHEKLRTVPIGFGEHACRLPSGVTEHDLRLIYNASFHHFDLMCEGHVEGSIGSALHVSHGSGPFGLSKDNKGVHSVRGAIRNMSTTAMAALGAPPTVYGKFDVVRRTMHAVTSLVGSSPRGTGADCHRHVELLLAGLTVIANKDEGGFQERMYASLPITFTDNHWTSIHCASVLKLIRESVLSQRSYEYERLTAAFWRRYIVDEVCALAGGQEGGRVCSQSFPQEWEVEWFSTDCHAKKRSEARARRS